MEAVGIMAQPVDRHDSRVFQAACHLCFQQESRPAVAVVRLTLLDLLEIVGSRASKKGLDGSSKRGLDGSRHLALAFALLFDHPRKR